MLNPEVIPAYEQTYLLNSQLIQHAGQLTNAVITVGGQAVQYWVSYFYAFYGDEVPDQRLVTSLDVDYSARKHDIKAIAQALNVDSSLNDAGNPPSLARFQLIDSDTKSIKQAEGKFFSDPEGPQTANTVDVIDWPAGFTNADFDGADLLLNTEPFLIELPEHEGPVMHEKVRVLNPIACIRSRLANLVVLHRSPEIELARIQALKIPCYYFILEAFDQRSFKEARAHFMNLYGLVWNKKFLSVQVDYRDSKPDISLIVVIEKIYQYLSEHFEDFDIPEKFVSHDLPRKLSQLRKRFGRYIILRDRFSIDK